MTADLAHVWMPKANGMVGLLFFEAAKSILLAVAPVPTRARFYTVLTVLRTHINNVKPCLQVSRQCLSSAQIFRLSL